MKKIMSEFIKEIVASPAVTKLMLFILFVAFAWFTKFIAQKIVTAMYFRITKDVTKLIKEMRWVRYKVEGIDYALGKCLNGTYTTNRDDKFNELVEMDEFINKSDL